MENWKPVAGYEGLYEISDQGNVRSLKFGKTKILKPVENGYGYLQIMLCKNGKSKRMYVHRLVAQAYIPNPNNFETVNHKDEVKTNNAARNLEWMTQKDNINYGTRTRRVAEANVNNPKMSKPLQQLDKQGNLLAVFPSTMEAERVTGTNQGHICECCLGNRKSAGGYIWRYV